MATVISRPCARCASGAAGCWPRSKKDRVVKLEGNPDHPHSRGKLCARGQSGLMNTYDPDRVSDSADPGRQTRRRPVPQASWEEALDLVAEKMLEIKAELWPGSDGLLLHP